MLALWELWHYGNSSAAREAAEKGARHLYDGEVWSSRDDLAELAWCVTAASRVMEGGVVDQEAIDGVRDWVGSIVEKIGKIPVGNTPEVAERGSALMLWPRLLLGEDAERGRYLQRQANRLACSSSLPKWEQDDLEYWYWGTNALFVLGGENWKEWRPAMAKTLLANRTKSGDPQGSWPAVGSDPARGEVRSTAMMALTLEVYIRYSKL